MDLAGKEVLVVGLARTGTAAARFLLSKGARLLIVDDREAAQLSPQIDQVLTAAGGDITRVKLCLGGTSLPPSANPAWLVLSPGVPLTHPAVATAARRGIPIISEIELASQFLKGSIAGITGSNGKTTCTTLLGAILARRYRTCVSGNIGRPLIDCIDWDDESVWHSVELSSYQLETIDRFCPRIAMLLNLSPDHLDRYGSMERYAAAKCRIFMNQTSSETAVLNADDPLVAASAQAVRARVLWFSGRGMPAEGLGVREGAVTARTREFQGEVMQVSEIRLRGAHNVENVVACCAAGLAAGVNPSDIAQAVREFRPVAHRLEYVATIRGVQFYNDSKATNVDAAAKAIEAFEEPLVAIMGGRDKGSDFSTLAPLVERRLRHLVLIGEAGPKIARALGGRVPWSACADMREAVATAFARATSGDVVVLAPACASFDMFRDYEQRGEVFKAEVSALHEANV